MDEKQQKEEDAKAFAYLIDSAATRCMSGEISLEQHNKVNKALWREAKRFGVFDEVSALIEAKSTDEMNAALKEMGL